MYTKIMVMYKIVIVRIFCMLSIGINISVLVLMFASVCYSVA